MKNLTNAVTTYNFKKLMTKKFTDKFVDNMDSFFSAVKNSLDFLKLKGTEKQKKKNLNKVF